MRHALHTAIVITALALALAGCSRRADRAGAVAPADTLANGVPRALLPRLAEWCEVWAHASPGFAPESLVRVSTEPFVLEGGWAGAGRSVDGVRSRARVDVASPDSAYSLDYDMYQDYSTGPDSSVSVEGEPDSSPILADFRRDWVYPLDFCGTGCFHDGAYWVDANRCALTGGAQSGEQADGPMRPVLDVFDLRTHLRSHCRGPQAPDPPLPRHPTPPAT